MDFARGAGDDSSNPKRDRSAHLSAWTTSSIASRFLVDLLDAAGQPPNALLQEAGISREQLAGSDAAMPLPAFRELWARAAALQPDIGLRLLERFPPGQMHMLAHLALRSANVQAALQDVCRHASVNSAADVLRLEVAAAGACFSYASRAPGDDNPWMAEHYLAMAVQFVGQATGRALPLQAVEFSGDRQAPASAYLARFGVAPRFGAGRNALVFDSQALAWPLLTHDAYLHGILERVALSRAATAPDDLVDRLREQLAKHLLLEQATTLESAARACGLSARSLRNRLAKQHRQFRQLLDEARRDLAREHLTRGLSVNETASLLGFSEPAAFQHACRRWFDCAAGEVRHSLRRA